MTITSGVSFLGQSNAQILRLSDLRATMDDLQRQVTTQKKYDTLTGHGLEAQRLLQLHADRDRLEGFNSNIDKTLTRVQLMDKTMNSIADAMRQMIDAMELQPSGEGFDIEDVSTRARQLLDFVVDLANTTYEGRYIFAGTDTQTPPISNKNIIGANFQAEITDWLNGTNTTTQMLDNAAAFTGTDLGYSSTISGAANMSVQVNNNLDIAYGAIADRSGVQDVVRVLGLLANLEIPDPSTDVPTTTDFDAVISELLSTGREAIQTMQSTQVSLTGKIDLIKDLQESHGEDINLFTTLLDKAENTDLTEAIASLQALQTQLTASYQVTQVVSQLSLANFIV